MKNTWMQNSDTNRIDFVGRNSLDGPLISQLLLRVRNLESAGGSIAYKRQFILYDDTIKLESAKNENVIIFKSNQILNVESTYFQNVTNESFNFGNMGTQDVNISDGFKIILSLVPGEFTSLIRFQNEWIFSLGLI